jgi:SAM-dependent MidA family methyltransferase
MIAKQLKQMWEIIGSGTFTIVEFGAGNGWLCHDILDYFKHHSEVYDKLDYCIIEKSDVMRTRQQQLLVEKVTWHDGLGELDRIKGCILSNELLDNFAVHLVEMGSELMEVFVGYADDFIEVKEPAGAALKQYLDELNIDLPQGFRAEINLDALPWLKELSNCLEDGYVLTIDYGGQSADLYTSRRSRGTLLCYNNHTINEEPYKNLGLQDITSHVNFSALMHYGSQYGLQTCGYTEQAHFLLSLGFKEWLRNSLDKGGDLLRMVQKEAFVSNRLLVDMGSKFKVLIQRKGACRDALDGLG